jgi:tetratricopeptide (TPR) repeat protein
LHQAQQAAADADRALTLFRKAIDDGSSSSRIGRAYLAQGRVLQQEGRLNQAREAYSLAAKHLDNTLGPNDPDSRMARQSAELIRASQ